jgi:hypothetical protein
VRVAPWRRMDLGRTGASDCRSTPNGG